MRLFYFPCRQSPHPHIPKGVFVSTGDTRRRVACGAYLQVGVQLTTPHKRGYAARTLYLPHVGARFIAVVRADTTMMHRKVL